MKGGRGAIILILAWITGACGLAYEYTFSKLASDLLGNTVEQWALTIAVMLFAMGLGADWQKRCPDRRLLGFFIFIEIVLALVGGWGGLLLLKVFVETRAYFVTVQMLLHFSIGLCIGMEIPLLTRLNAQTKHTLKNNLAEILRLDYWGAFMGALVWIYVLIRYLPTALEILFLVSAFNLMAPMLTLFLYRKSFHEAKWRLMALTTATVLSLVSCIIGLIWTPKWVPAMEQQLFRDRILVSEHTPYQHIILTENKHKDLRLYLNGQLQFSSVDEYIYHEMLVHPAIFLAQSRDGEQGEDPSLRVLILGGGDGLAVREVLKHTNVAAITLVDIDVGLIALAQTHPRLRELNADSLNRSEVEVVSPVPDPKASRLEERHLLISRAQSPHRVVGETTLRILPQDAYAFLTEEREKWPRESFDVIIADFPDPNRLELSKLYSKSFYVYARDLLSPEGVFIQQASSPYYARETFALIGATLEDAGFTALPLQTWIPSFGEWGWYIAQKNMPEIPGDPSRLATQLQESVKVGLLRSAASHATLNTAPHTAAAQSITPNVNPSANPNANANPNATANPTPSASSSEESKAGSNTASVTSLAEGPRMVLRFFSEQTLARALMVTHYPPSDLTQTFPQKNSPKTSAEEVSLGKSPKKEKSVNTLLNHLAYKTYRKELLRFE